MAVPVPRTTWAVRKQVGRRIANRVVGTILRLKVAKTLTSNLYITDNRDETIIGVPHYWAPYYHFGRGPVRPRGDRSFLVWFRDPLRNDPRLKNLGRFPITRREAPRLTAEQFKKGLEANKRAPPGNPIMFVRKMSPQSGGRAKANPFFDKAFDYVAGNARDDLADFADEALTAHIDWSSKHFRKIAGTNPQSATYRKTIRIRLRRNLV